VFTGWWTWRGASTLKGTFSSATQVVPDGAASLEVNQVLERFNFSQPLPFFDKNNVVQSLDFAVNPPSLSAASSTSFLPKAKIIHSASTSSQAPQPKPPTFLSYRIWGQNKAAIETAFIEYFRNMGWKMANTLEGQPLVSSSQTHQIVSVTLLDAPTFESTPQPAITVALVVQ